MRKKFFIAGGVLFAVFLLAVILIANTGEPEPTIHLETHSALSGKADSDGDGVPNWLEEITESDALNAESFPYNRDIVRARENTANTERYAGPGEYTEQIIQRFLLDIDGTASVTEKEKKQFVDESVNYFMEAVEKRGLPEVPLTVDDTVSRREVLRQFAAAMEGFSGAEKPIDELVFEVFSKKAGVEKVARETRESCSRTMQTMPRRVPRDVYRPYLFVLERVTYLCEALTVSLTATTADGFFYAIRLMSAGELMRSTADETDEDKANQFEEAVSQIVRLLEQ